MARRLDKESFSIRSLKEIALMIIDLLIVGVCFMASAILSQVYVLQTDVTKNLISDAFIALPIALVLFAISLWIFRVPKVVWRYARGKDFLRILGANCVALTVFIILDQSFLHLIAHPDTSIGIGPSHEQFKAYPAYIMMGFSILCTLILSRLIYEFAYSRLRDRAMPRMRKRTLIIGAGYTASTILEELTRSNSLYDPICMLDDDPEKLGRIIDDVPVVGNTQEISKFVAKYAISNIIFAIPSIDNEARKRILNDCNATACQVKVLPYMSEMIKDVGMVKQMRDINIADLLGRPQISFGDVGVASYLFDKTVMITGGGGSIGSELCRQISKYKPRRIVVMDIYENCAYNIQQELLRTYGKDYPVCVEIATMCDYDKMEEIFRQYHPQIVFHAAAHKHVPLMETNPEEAVKNNVFGTLNVVMLSDLYKVQKFIMVSTDKAVNPTNVMGATKRCCEEIIQMMAQSPTTKTEFAAVRFGNVLGSNGSVIPLFRDQIASGGPVTVTHKDIIRYFMTIPEAVSLVLQAGAFAKGGEIFVLDMGSPVKIVTLAENLIRMMGYTPYEDIEIRFTGLRPGEKLYEELLMQEEGLGKTSNDKIYVGKQVEVNKEHLIRELDKMQEICKTNDKAAVVQQLQVLVPTFKPDWDNLKRLQEQYDALQQEYKPA